MDIGNVSSLAFQPQSKPSALAEEARETQTQKRAELLKGEKATNQVQPQAEKSPQPVVEAKKTHAAEGAEKQKSDGGFDITV